jgi:phage shock protein PspC (stress-responsive transcriptional regulator)
MKKYKRNSKDVIIGGVASGFAEYINADPTLIRLIWALLAIFSFGIFFLAYIILWLIAPVNHKKKNK